MLEMEKVYITETSWAISLKCCIEGLVCSINLASPG